jgi:hypothetical protein
MADRWCVSLTPNYSPIAQLTAEDEQLKILRPGTYEPYPEGQQK